MRVHSAEVQLKIYWSIFACAKVELLQVYFRYTSKSLHLNTDIQVKSSLALLSILPHVQYIHTENWNSIQVQLPDSLMDEAVLQSAGPRLETPQSPPWWQQTEEAVCRVGGITCNAEGFAGETGAVDVLEGGERDTNDLLSCSHYPLKGLVAGRVAGAIPHSDAASQDALDGASVESAHDGGRGSGSSEFAEEVETLLCFLGQSCSVVSPGEVLCDVHTQELGIII